MTNESGLLPAEKEKVVQTETRVLMDWMMKVQPTLALSLRSGYQGIITPSYGKCGLVILF